MSEQSFHNNPWPPPDVPPFIMAIAPSPPCIRLMGPDGGFLVSIDVETGAHEFGPGYTPDEAARAFWDAVGRFCPTGAGEPAATSWRDRGPLL